MLHVCEKVYDFSNNVCEYKVDKWKSHYEVD